MTETLKPCIAERLREAVETRAITRGICAEAADTIEDLLEALEKAAVRFETVRARIYRLGVNPGMKALELADYTRQCEAEIDAVITRARGDAQ
jgi:hypothetical protein